MVCRNILAGAGSDPELLKWFVQAELQNARWAMLAVPGCLVPEAITKVSSYLWCRPQARRVALPGRPDFRQRVSGRSAPPH